ncbi:hypothetical protein C8D70_104271 [Chryseobacterium sp. CBTAP 102]|nr:hypothetical protein C8D70_104271 [Chryseobacterium sp. CBTAP 102]SIQ50480.1 hypothetical protein SAMN05880573_10647 [Chryseobacterium sp. RU33C]
MKAELKNNPKKKYTIKNMMKDICMPVHEEHCG